MFRIKICGITSSDDARMAIQAGADAIGLNFFPASPRSVDRAVAENIVEAVDRQISVVGVFVNAPVTEMVELADHLPLDVIQLHGDEPVEQLADLAPRQVIRAWRLRAGSEPALIKWVAEGERRGVPPAAILIDAYRPGDYGGTGARADWARVCKLRSSFTTCPLLLAGGLTPENVHRAIFETRCDGVDIASGVESHPGHKDAGKTQAFVRAAREAFRARMDAPE